MWNPYDNPDEWYAYKEAERERKKRPWKRGAISKKLRKRVFEEKGRRCSYCDLDGCNELDHAIPVCQFGESSFENLVPVCGWCNLSKGGSTVQEWYGRLAKKWERE